MYYGNNARKGIKYIKNARRRVAVKRKCLYILCLLLATFFICFYFGCEKNGNPSDDDAADDDTTDDDAIDDDADDDGPYYDPTWAVPMSVLPEIRGLKVIRGIVHAHSIYSHDACDNNPVGNEECLAQLREALCKTQQNYLMLTDHDDSFADNEFPDVLLYRPEEGDALIYDDQDRPFANILTCPDALTVTIMAGTENDTMPVHLHQHPPGTIQDRYAVYGRTDPAVADILRGLGASVFINHDEGWSIADLIAFAPDGLEIFNLHAAIDPDIRPLLGLPGLDYIDDVMYFLTDPQNPQPNLIIMAFWPETQAWNERWDALLAVQKATGIAATDVHRNALPFNLSDGERADGYRRMMQFFSNHLLVEDEDPSSIEYALDHGRAYAAFEFLGFPFGFDFYAKEGDNYYEMGKDVNWKSDLKIFVKCPKAFHIDPNGLQPEITCVLIKVDEQGSTIVAGNQGDIEYAVPGPGAYRVEVHIVPWHLTPWLGSDPNRFIHDYPWIYANPIYVK